jgi:uncharacterized cupin superfamily protein
MAKIDISAVPLRTGSIYPPPYDAEVSGRTSQRLGDAGGLTQFGANLVHLAPGAKSSMRHWHEAEDEFVMVTAGVVVMVTDAGETEMLPGDCAAFPAGRPDGHHFINRSERPASFLVVGSRASREVAHYPDKGLKVVVEGGKATFLHEDGRPLSPET